MIGKIKEGKSFGGCVAYNLEREKAEILYAEGIRTTNSKTITQDFNMQRKMNPNLKKAVGHIILSWSANDRAKLDSDRMLKDAKEYLDKMNIRNTQLLVVEHLDRNHPHLHIIYNRVNNDGKSIANNNLWKRNIQVTQAITKSNGYYFAAGKENINRGRLIGKDKVKLEIFDAVKSAIKTADSWESLRNQLKYRGIDVQYKYARNSLHVQGISFSKNGIVFKGSQVDRSLSYAKIDQTLQGNSLKLLSNAVEHKSTSITNTPIEDLFLENKKSEGMDYGKIGVDLAGILFSGAGHIANDEVDPNLKRKRKKKKQSLTR